MCPPLSKIDPKLIKSPRTPPTFVSFCRTASSLMRLPFASSERFSFFTSSSPSFLSSFELVFIKSAKAASADSSAENKEEETEEEGEDGDLNDAG